MDRHVPDCLVTGYEPIIPTLTLPDPDDRHVLAAAIRCGAGSIVTFNLGDFPASALGQFDTEPSTRTSSSSGSGRSRRGSS